VKHFYFYDGIKGLTLKELVNVLNQGEKISLGDIKLTDLVYQKQSLTGVYIFYAPDGIPRYVGKSGSRAILERIAGHLDLREFSFMNSFLKMMANEKNLPHNRLNELYEEALTYQMVFIAVDQKYTCIQLEKMLGTNFRGLIWNSIKSAKIYDETKTVEELVG